MAICTSPAATAAVSTMTTRATVGTGNGQDITANLWGTMLRIDVDSDDFPADATRNYAIPPDNPFVAGSPLCN
ncbi:MAG: hypothetical protein IH849_02575 [Acidobacteria bacterium]|nr:hypothetical protein [Acidobacteriota bacterium]